MITPAVTKVRMRGIAYRVAMSGISSFRAPLRDGPGYTEFVLRPRPPPSGRVLRHFGVRVFLRRRFFFDERWWSRRSLSGHDEREHPRERARNPPLPDWLAARSGAISGERRPRCRRPRSGDVAVGAEERSAAGEVAPLVVGRRGADGSHGVVV